MDDIKTMIKLFNNNYEAAPDVQLKLAQLQESMGLASSLPQLFRLRNCISKDNKLS